MAGREGARSPKTDPALREAFRALVPDDERVTIKPMFGTLAAFVNGLMFMGLFADELFVRVNDEDQARVRAEGGGVLEPMPGKPMRGYVTIGNWQQRPDTVREWAATALDYTLTLPPKKK